MLVRQCNGTEVPCLLKGYGDQGYFIPYEFDSFIGPEKIWDANAGNGKSRTFQAEDSAHSLERPTIALLVSSYVVHNLSFIHSISYAIDPYQSAAFWGFCFVISKLFELADTVFVVLRKKPLIFLHWYHHAIVLVYVCHAVREGVALSRPFMFMNNSVHALMYAYYAISAAGFRLPRPISITITTLQTTQMFIAIATTFVVFGLKLQGRIVQQSYENLFFCFAIYLSFAVLFSNFFKKAYLVEKKQKEKVMFTRHCNGTAADPCVLEGRGIHAYFIPYEFDSFIGPEKWWDQDRLRTALDFGTQYWSYSILVAIIYSVGIHAVQRAMLTREPFKLKWPLIFWNTFLSLFSLAGAIRIGEEFFYVARHRSLLDTISYAVDPYQPAAFWSFCFTVSKIFELFDTVFVVLRKKPLIFLHWYHHAIVLVYVCHAAPEFVACSRPFMLMNYSVHFVMYAYYAITAAGFRLPRMISMTITTLQTTQMFIAVATTFVVFGLKLQGRIVQQSYENLFFCFAIYLSFAYLFSDFFSTSYIDKKPKEKTQ